MSLKIYLSGAATFGGISSPNISLGRYPSSDEIQDAMIGNLFGTISEYNLHNLKNEVRAVILQNDSETDTLTDITMWSEYQTGFAARYQFGVVALTTDSCGDAIFPRSVASIYAMPSGVTFTENAEEGNSLVIGTLEPEMMIGLWIKRMPEAAVAYTDEELAQITNGELEPTTREDLLLHFNWTD
jgi:hypothetical protein